MPERVVSGRIRLGILALLIGDALLLSGNVVFGLGLSSSQDVEAYAAFAASAQAAAANFLISVGALFDIFGFVALYACMAYGRSERWAFFAMVLCVPGVASTFASSAGTSGWAAVAAEGYLQGQRAVLEEGYGLLDWSSVFLASLSFAFLIGLVLFGVAIWRTSFLPRGAAVLWFAYVLDSLAIPLTPWAGVVAFVLAILADGWIAWAVWRRP